MFFLSFLQPLQTSGDDDLMSLGKDAKEFLAKKEVRDWLFKILK